MKNEIIEVIKNNKPKVAIGILIAGLALTQSEIQFEHYSTLEQMRQKDNSPANRYRLDYGGNVKWLKDELTGDKWDAMGKDQCLKGTDYDSSKVFEYVDKDNVLNIEPLKKPILKFKGLQDTTKRLQPADNYTSQYIFSRECQITDY